MIAPHMVLYDASVGDIIGIPTHHPRVVTVTGYLGGFGTSAYIHGWTAGDLMQLSWTAEDGWAGVTSLSEATVIDMVSKAGPDDPVRKQYEADLAAELAKLADTIGEG